MVATLQILNSFCLLSILISLGGAHGVNIQAYRHKNFTVLAWESHSTGNCSNIPINKRTPVSSIRTDTCFIVYEYPDCNVSRSQKYMPGDIVTSYRDIPVIDSFQVCNEAEGGSQLNLDITTYYLTHYIVPDVLESFKNVCSCVNVPHYVQNMLTWSINNHHNALLAYYEPDCSENKWTSKLIAAGHNLYSSDVHKYTKTDEVTKITFKYQSFGPDPNSTYFQTSCNSSHLITTEHSKMFESTTDSGNDANVEKDNLFQDGIISTASLATSNSCFLGFKIFMFLFCRCIVYAALYC